MFEVGQEVTVITEKGAAYNGYVLARATGDRGMKAYKVALDGAGLNQTGQWHKESDLFVLEPKATARTEPQIYMRSFARH